MAGIDPNPIVRGLIDLVNQLKQAAVSGAPPLDSALADQANALISAGPGPTPAPAPTPTPTPTSLAGGTGQEQNPSVGGGAAPEFQLPPGLTPEQQQQWRTWAQQNPEAARQYMLQQQGQGGMNTGSVGQGRPQP